MDPTHPQPVADPVDVIAAERAGTAYWREVAHQRRVEAARVQRRPIVRVAIAVDRRTQRMQDALQRGARRVRHATRRAAVVGPGVLRRVATRPHVEDGRAPTASDARPDRDILVIHVVADDRAAGSIPAPATTVEVPFGDTLTVDIDHVIRQSSSPWIALLGPAARPGEDWSWLDHLAGALAGPVVASTPQTVHPRRSWSAATAHDLLTRTRGLDLQNEDGLPSVVARGAGQRPERWATTEDVAAGATALLVDRDAWLQAGGLRQLADRRTADREHPADQFDGLLVDLCMRLRDGGGRVVVVGAALLVDDRPVRVRSALATPIDLNGPAWRAVVERHGPALARSANQASRSDHRTTVALTTATPSLKLASRSGDWHFAQDLAEALRRSGCDVRTQTAEQADSLAGRACDIHLVLRGLEPVAHTPGQRYVLWIISHPEAIEPAECDRADLVLVASERYAAYLATQTATPVEVLQQATNPTRFRPLPVDPTYRHRLTVVANTRGGPRAAVSNALAAGLHPAVYGEGWEGRIGTEDWAGGYLGPEVVPVAYGSADVVLNDHWDTMRHWGFVSNRIFDVLACATPVVSDHLPEIADLFGGLVPTWSSPEELRQIVEALWADPSAAADRAATGRRLVLDAHTFDHRVTQLRELLARHDLWTDWADA